MAIPVPIHNQSHDRLDRLFSAAGMLFLILLAVPLPMPGRLSAQAMLADLLAPVLLWRVLRRRPKCPLLMLYFGWCLLSAGMLCFRGELAWYNLSIAGYMAVIYLFFRETPLLDARLMLATGLAVLGAYFLFWLVPVATGGAGGWAAGLFYADPHGGTLASGPLMSRYQFLFTNPNLLGVAYLVPMVMILPEMQSILERAQGRSRALLWLVLLAALCLPLASTMSKHALMTLSLLSSLFVAGKVLPRPAGVALAFSVTLLFGAVCLATVWFCSFPAVRRAPWLDPSRPGNYMTHQRVYAEILRDGDLPHALFGYTPGELRRRYPECASGHREWMAAVLKPYHADDWLEVFTTFMDPHNEYLNAAAFFGLPAAIFLALFLAAHAVSAARCGYLPMLFFIPALMLCCMWDDLGSKRWIWTALGVLSARMAACRPRRSHG